MPDDFEHENFKDLLRHKHVRIERIVSRGHASPADGWYDQETYEWVMVLEGGGTILFEDGNEVTLKKGDFLDIPSRTRHKVTWTDPARSTIWLAVFITDES